MTSKTVTQETFGSVPSPNDLLASQITESLVTAGLIKDSHKGQLLAKLKTGGVTQEDWNLWISMASVPKIPQGEP